MSIRRDALIALRERVVAAKGADREIDAQAVAALNNACYRPYPTGGDQSGGARHQFWSLDGAHFLGNESRLPVPPLTASSDEAIALAERLLPPIKSFAPGSPSSSGWKLSFYRGMTPTGAPYAHWQANIREHARDGYDGDAATLPLAILAALFSALLASETPDA